MHNCYYHAFKSGSLRKTKSLGFAGLNPPALHYSSQEEWLFQTVASLGRWLGGGFVTSVAMATRRVVQCLLLALVSGLAMSAPAFGEEYGALHISPSTIAEAGGTASVGISLFQTYLDYYPSVGLAIGGDAALGADFTVTSSDGDVVRVFDDDNNHIGYYVSPRDENPPTATITAVDDSVTDPGEEIHVYGMGGGQRLVDFVWADSDNDLFITYPGFVTIEDDDVRGVTVSRTSLELDGGESGTYTVKLTSQPADTDTGTVTVTPRAPPNTGVSLNTSSLTFSSSNWSTAQTVTVSVTADAAPGTVTITHQVEGSDYEENGVTADPVTVVIPPPHVTLLLSPAEISENGGVSRVTASLSRTSSAVTTVMVSAAPVSPAVSRDFTQSGTTLTIAAGQTSSTGTVRITAVDNDVDAPDKQVTVSGSASNTQGVTGPDDVTLTIEDDDVRGVTVSRTSLELDGGESGTYTVKLTSQPAGTDSVTVTPSAPPNTGVSLNTSSLTFSSSNWSTAQTVTVSVAADAAPGTVTITHQVEGSDYEENGVTADPLTVVIPPPHVTLLLSPAEISENGGVSRVTARLSLPRAR